VKSEWKNGSESIAAVFLLCARYGAPTLQNFSFAFQQQQIYYGLTKTIIGVRMDIGVYQAKTHLPELLAKVASGEQITITRHGRAVARLVPAEPVRQRDVRGVIEELKILAKGRRADLPIREMIAEGRR
jgi:prevent-host-death family protein